MRGLKAVALRLFWQLGWVPWFLRLLRCQRQGLGFLPTSVVSSEFKKETLAKSKLDRLWGDSVEGECPYWLARCIWKCVEIWMPESRTLTHATRTSWLRRRHLGACCFLECSHALLRTSDFVCSASEPFAADGLALMTILQSAGARLT